MKLLMTVKDAIEYINKGAFGIFNISYKVLDVQKIKYAQHLAACERKRKERLEEARKKFLEEMQDYIEKQRTLGDKCYLEARRVPRFCRTKKFSYI
ncbi:hypothetical protein [Phascolarctobacterium succinatutens]|uniref:hypothetical protein n=1 Tax=Phascolarctobacterium succinatutens TaxID=626940 RepID=UPI0026ED0045|nr:hypothetical protein [Phascolarctobacterium succinatutens]